MAEVIMIEVDSLYNKNAIEQFIAGSVSSVEVGNEGTNANSGQKIGSMARSADYCFNLHSCAYYMVQELNAT